MIKNNEKSKTVEKKCKDFLQALNTLADEYGVSIIRHKRDWDDTILIDFDLTPKNKSYLLKNKDIKKKGFAVSSANIYQANSKLN
ncbi:hypothetical protein [Treponema putidum]|uniref:hypothetical protein n=1 Tax=Treponema putidum TaxID=221027 RepID=UPI003D8DCFBA